MLPLLLSRFYIKVFTSVAYLEVRGSSNTRDSKLKFGNDTSVFVFLYQAFRVGM